MKVFLRITRLLMEQDLVCLLTLLHVWDYWLQKDFRFVFLHFVFFFFSFLFDWSTERVQNSQNFMCIIKSLTINRLNVMKLAVDRQQCWQHCPISLSVSCFCTPTQIHFNSDHSLQQISNYFFLSRANCGLVVGCNEFCSHDMPGSYRKKKKH